ncbi:MAG: epoxyqueuosine reductase, partial [Candidatus Bathyarchaeia archaeon]
FIVAQGGEYLKHFPRAISIGVRLLDAVVDALHRHNDRTALLTYRALYNTVNSRLDQIAFSIAEKIQTDGYRAYPIPASQTVDQERLLGTVSHKLVAHLSGLGWIGKSCLLITPECGPRVRFATVMTDAPLKTGSPIPNRCGECRRCVEVCPPKALTGVTFNASEHRDVRFKAHLCEQYMKQREERLGEGLCGLCVYICRYGKRETTCESRPP